MRTLIIPDIHERIDKLGQLSHKVASADRVVQIGDWFDTFKPMDADRVRLLCQFIKAWLREGKEALLGNHDCHYFFHHNGFGCSGYRPATKAIIEEMITPDEIRKFKLWTRVGKFTVSHAGFHPDTVSYLNPYTQQVDLIEAAIRGELPKLFGAGRARGGHNDVGGPTWLDWQWEFEDIPGLPQIVGHSVGKEVRQKGDSYCIDTALNHVMWVDEDTNEVIIEEVV